MSLCFKRIMCLKREVNTSPPIVAYPLTPGLQQCILYCAWHKYLIRLFCRVTLHDFSPPPAARPFLCELRTWQLAAARSATHTKHLRTVGGSEKSRKEKRSA